MLFFLMSCVFFCACESRFTFHIFKKRLSRKQISAKAKNLREPKTQLKNTNISQLSKPDMEGNFNAAGKLFYYYICLSQILRTQLKALKTSTLNLHPAPHRGRSGFCPLFLIVFYKWNVSLMPLSTMNYGDNVEMLKFNNRYFTHTNFPTVGRLFIHVTTRDKLSF